MTTIQADLRDFKELNQQIRACTEDQIVIENCIGQRYIGDGASDKTITIYGVPGNALGAYLNGAQLIVHGNAQDAIGDTMNCGQITVHGNAGDAAGYAMRGGTIMVRGSVGYRAGIHMKAYQDKAPELIAGGCAGSFLGEYQAGGTIVILGLDGDGSAPVGDFCGTGMHGGAIYLRCQQPPQGLPVQVLVRQADAQDMAQIAGLVKRFCQAFDLDAQKILADRFYKLTPNTATPYKTLYTHI